MTDYRDQVTGALRAAAVVSPSSYTWFGRRSRPLHVAVRGSLPPSVAQAHLVRALEDRLYRSFYSQGAPVPLTPHADVPTRSVPAFVDALSRSNAGRGGWDAGWRVEHVEPSGPSVARDGLVVRARAADCRPPDAARTGGAMVSLRRPKEQRAVAPGFYTVLGDAEAAGGPHDSEVRVYFHVTADGAAPLVAACTRVLNRAGAPFVFKVLDNPAAFRRCDAAVLYLRTFARDPLRTIVARCGRYLRAGVPAFTKPLAPGVAVGEHRPEVGDSFGRARCRLVAQAIVDAHERRAVSLEVRVDAVARWFAGSGLDLDVPYLVAGSVDDYAL